jgi:integrase
MQRILAAAAEGRNGERWAIALALGLRQGEALALTWADVDLDARALRVRATRLRPVYRHGCGGTCGHSPGHCPKRQQLNAASGETKSAAGRRVVGLPEELVALLARHRREQDAERRHAANLWVEGGWLFASRTGEPLNPNSDYHAWKALLRAPGIATFACRTRATRWPPCSSSWVSPSAR